MKSRVIAIIALIAGMVALPQIAAAAEGYVTGDLNLRTCASVRCARIAVMPRGAPVLIIGSQSGWYQLSYRGLVGFASARYVAALARYYRRRPPRLFDDGPFWNDRYRPWYDGRRRYDRRSGVYFRFGFGR